MKNKNIIIISLFLIILGICLGYAYYMNNHEEEHQSYNLGIITLNTTNTINFTYELNETRILRYVDNSGKITINIISFDNATRSQANTFKQNLQEFKSHPSQDVNDIVVYTTTATIGEYVEETHYEAMIENHDLNVTTDICTPDINETAYIAKNTKFN